MLMAAMALVSACNSGGGDAAPGAIFSNHKAVSNTFTATISGKYYVFNDNLDIKLSFPKNITVSGLPRISIDIGGTQYYALYTSGSGSKNLIFRYVVALNDLDTDGIELANSIDLNGGTLKFNNNGSSENCNLTYIKPKNLSNVRVDAETAAINNLYTPNPGTYLYGQKLSFDVEFTEVVNVTGTPQLAFDIGGTLNKRRLCCW